MSNSRLMIEKLSENELRFYHKERWMKALENKDFYEVCDTLISGFVPDNLAIEVTVIDKAISAEISQSLVDLLVRRYVTNGDWRCIETADALIEQGAPFRKYMPINASKSGNLSELGCHPCMLFRALRTDPAIVNQQDEDGMTILHHAVLQSPISTGFSVELILKLLFAMPNLDLNIPDKNGSTALHAAAYRSSNRTTRVHLFPALVDEAIKKKFNFNSLDKDGNAIIHLAYDHRRALAPLKGYVEYCTAIDELLIPIETIKLLGINVLSSDGETVLFKAVSTLCIEVAHNLLMADANPAIFGTNDKSPIDEITKFIEGRSMLIQLAETYATDKFISMINTHRNILQDCFSEEMGYKASDDDLQAYGSRLAKDIIETNIAEHRSFLNRMMQLKNEMTDIIQANNKKQSGLLGSSHPGFFESPKPLSPVNSTANIINVGF